MAKETSEVLPGVLREHGNMRISFIGTRFFGSNLREQKMSLLLTGDVIGAPRRTFTILRVQGSVHHPPLGRGAEIVITSIIQNVLENTYMC